jgi:hypothetical protein
MESRTPDKGRGPPAWGLGKVGQEKNLPRRNTNPDSPVMQSIGESLYYVSCPATHRKKYHVMNRSNRKPLTWTDTLGRNRHVTKHNYLLFFKKQPANFPYPKPDKSSPHFPHCFFMIHFNVVLPPTLPAT